MKPSKTFKQVLSDLESGEKIIKSKINNCQSFRDAENLKSDLKIQKTKIEFLKKGYSFAKRELGYQSELKLDEGGKK
jgi:hypothetical protein